MANLKTTPRKERASKRASERERERERDGKGIYGSENEKEYVGSISSGTCQPAL
jgi:hypothetical protein